MCSWSLASEPFTMILLRGARRAPRWCGHESSLGLSKKPKITVELRGPVGKSVPSLWGWESLEYPMTVCLGVCVCVARGFCKGLLRVDGGFWVFLTELDSCPAGRPRFA